MKSVIRNLITCELSEVISNFSSGRRSNLRATSTKRTSHVCQSDDISRLHSTMMIHLPENVRIKTTDHLFSICEANKPHLIHFISTFTWRRSLLTDVHRCLRNSCALLYRKHEFTSVKYDYISRPIPFPGCQTAKVMPT